MTMKLFSIRHILGAAIAALALLTGCKDAVHIEPTIDVSAGKDAEFSKFKVVSYNILEGMKNDKANNYDNFVAWVTEQKPDVLALEECNGFTAEFLADLARRWGHEYVAFNSEHKGMYPVALTSKYPVEVVKFMQDAGNHEIYHNAIHAKIKGVNVVVLHLYPFSKYPNSSSAEVGSGEEYRVREMNYILDNTIRKYPTEPYWLMMGDFNSYSPLDKDQLGNDKYYDVHSLVLKNGYYDAVRERHNHFINSTAHSRLDFIYCSQSILRNMTEAEIVKDDFTTMQVPVGEDKKEQISDHFPVTVTFRYN